MTRKTSIFLMTGCLLLTIHAYSQYAPGAGKPGSTAIPADSPLFKAWGESVRVYRGWKNIADKDSGLVTVGDEASACGPAGENGVVSLGDSGSALYTLANPLWDGPGWDFAIFENGFDDQFLELAFVEISSDGKRFFRFPAHSLSDTTTQTGAFGLTDPEKINNLAGKYRAGFGTPFDISGIPDYKDLNKNSITHIRIVDVTGSLLAGYASTDTSGRKINDPWPTPFPSGGFDLDALGLIHPVSAGLLPPDPGKPKVSGSNPVSEGSNLTISGILPGSRMTMLTYGGQVILSKDLLTAEEIIPSILIPSGLFIVVLTSENGVMTYHGIKK